MANPKHLKILNQGAEAWNNWRKENPKMRPDLRVAHLRWALAPLSELLGTPRRFYRGLVDVGNP